MRQWFFVKAKSTGEIIRGKAPTKSGFYFVTVEIGGTRRVRLMQFRYYTDRAPGFDYYDGRLIVAWSRIELPSPTHKRRKF